MTVQSLVEAWRMFHVQVSAVVRVSPSFVRVTFTGPDLCDFADNGWDQRFKLILPVPGRDFADLPEGPDWYDAWRRLPTERQNPIRTYTVRAVRASRHEVDIDMVLHGDTGPASSFAGRACPGDRVVLVGPNAPFPGVHGGVEFSPPAGQSGPVLMAADETAVPAVASILPRLPADAIGDVLLEVPVAADRFAVDCPSGVRLRWLPRSGAPHGSRLVPAVRDLDLNGGPIYAWLAGESSVVTTLRRHLVRDRGVDRRAVTFMGYWRRGRPGA